MPLVLNEEQRLLRDTARDFLASHAPVSALRKLRDERNPLGYEPQLWRQMAELGWASIILPEQYGGLDFGFLGLGLVMEECGRTLVASPLFASAVVGASALLLGGSAASLLRQFLGLPASLSSEIDRLAGGKLFLDGLVSVWQVGGQAEKD